MIIVPGHIYVGHQRKSPETLMLTVELFYSMRRIGNGYEEFLMLMNHPPPMTEKHYRTTSSVFNKSVKKVAKIVMHEAAEEIQWYFI